MQPPLDLPPDDAFNRALVNNVRPGDWKNPEPAARYHLVVIGAGTAGLVAAAGAAGLGAKVALVERQLMGGDCLNYGCVPSKALLSAARIAATARHAGAFGAATGGDVAVDFPAVMERMRRLRSALSRHDSAERFRSLGVDVFLGDAKFVSRDAIAVGSQTLRFRKAVIATGARAAAPPIPGLDAAGYLTNETIFSLTQLPRRLAVIGGGPIGCEMSQCFARFGTQVTLFERGGQLLPREDADAAGIVESALQRDGVTLLKNCRITQIRAEDNGKVICCERDGGPPEFAVDQILVAIGRAPNVEGLELETAGVDYDRTSGVKVDDRLRTTNPRIFAAGDICFPYKFTHTADFQARIVLQNSLFLGRARASRLTIPWCTYTSPEVAHVGISSQAAAAAGDQVQTLVQELSGVDRAVLDGETEGFVKIHLQAGSDRILGATIVAAHAGDLISEISVAMTNGIGLKGIGKTIHPYPTQAEAIRKLGDAYNRSRLTPFVKRLFAVWFRWTL